jgi:L-amino acid N-acyltransferase YncA
VNIVAARPIHLPAITAIFNEAILERIASCELNAKTMENRAQWFTQFDARHPIFVGEVSDEVCCYGCLNAYSSKPGYRYTVEHSLYVAKSARGAGYGKLMLSHLIGEARRLKYHYLEGGVFGHNAASLALHKALGFSEVGVKREVANLDGKWADVVFMALLLQNE